MKKSSIEMIAYILAHALLRQQNLLNGQKAPFLEKVSLDFIPQGSASRTASKKAS